MPCVGPHETPNVDAPQSRINVGEVNIFGKVSEELAEKNRRLHLAGRDPSHPSCMSPEEAHRTQQQTAEVYNDIFGDPSGILAGDS